MDDTQTYNKPLPALSDANRAFWQATTVGRLALPHCRACGNVWFPPSLRCPRCLSSNVDTQQVSGKGRLWSWIVMHRRYIDGFEPPYVVAFVELEEGPMLISTVVDTAVEQLHCGMLLDVVFEPATGCQAIPKFRPTPGTLQSG